MACLTITHILNWCYEKRLNFDRDKYHTLCNKWHYNTIIAVFDPTMHPKLKIDFLHVCPAQRINSPRYTPTSTNLIFHICSEYHDNIIMNATNMIVIYINPALWLCHVHRQINNRLILFHGASSVSIN